MVKTFTDYFKLDADKFTATDFQALVLLHELGHSLGHMLPDASNLNANVKNTQKVIDNCFKDLKK